MNWLSHFTVDSYCRFLKNYFNISQHCWSLRFSFMFSMRSKSIAFNMKWMDSKKRVFFLVYMLKTSCKSIVRPTSITRMIEITMNLHSLIRSSIWMNLISVQHAQLKVNMNYFNRFYNNWRTTLNGLSIV